MPLKRESAPLPPAPTDSVCYIVDYAVTFAPSLAEIVTHIGEHFPIFDARVAGTAKFAHAEHAPVYLTVKQSQASTTRYVKAIHIVPTDPAIVMDQCWRCDGTAIRVPNADCFECKRCGGRMFTQPHYTFSKAE